jgi:hypothetical protein
MAEERRAVKRRVSYAAALPTAVLENALSPFLQVQEAARARRISSIFNQGLRRIQYWSTKLVIADWQLARLLTTENAQGILSHATDMIWVITPWLGEQEIPRDRRPEIHPDWLQNVKKFTIEFSPERIAMTIDFDFAYEIGRARHERDWFEIYFYLGLTMSPHRHTMVRVYRNVSSSWLDRLTELISSFAFGINIVIEGISAPQIPARPRSFFNPGTTLILTTSAADWLAITIGNEGYKIDKLTVISNAIAAVVAPNQQMSFKRQLGTEDYQQLLGNVQRLDLNANEMVFTVQEVFQLLHKNLRTSANLQFLIMRCDGARAANAAVNIIGRDLLPLLASLQEAIFLSADGKDVLARIAPLRF